MITVAAVRLYRIQLPMRTAMEHASAKRSRTDNLVCEVELSTGQLGHGEGVPRVYVTGETFEACWADAVSLAERVLGRGASDLAGAVALAERIGDEVVDSATIVRSNSRCALELALLDAYARSFGAPWAAFATARAGHATASSAPLRYSLIVTPWLIEDRARLVDMLARHRFDAAKIKVGFGLEQDVATTRVLRETMGPAADLRLDANRALSAEDATRLMRAVRPLGVRVIEDPVVGDTLEAQAPALRALRRDEGVVVVLDESFRTGPEARRATELEAVDVLNLRLAKCGGLLRTLDIARDARAAGVRVQLGCQVGETAILTAAQRHAAAAIGDAAWLEGANERLKFAPEHFLSVEDLSFDADAIGPRLVGPGLAVTIDRARLQAFASERLERRLGEAA